MDRVNFSECDLWFRFKQGETSLITAKKSMRQFRLLLVTHLQLSVLELDLFFSHKVEVKPQTFEYVDKNLLNPRPHLEKFIRSIILNHTSVCGVCAFSTRAGLNLKLTSRQMCQGRLALEHPQRASDCEGSNYQKLPQWTTREIQCGRSRLSKFGRSVRELCI
ncbi:hypothetical protein CROQUDRAFT_668436 [Cronartium quercuum f. sp. fusiforme G11]|uniref:Uncharacterized protein n=1 Tax=Cronartium quercuum f. sp. fusiforme G11 TaxID=708437 RepID=A0A9P6NVZ3_9BASI|nr:hypothetical protein CROQUDRAFT_668436 [Cronartium quercuum f. sp. fusiforme G11]